MSTATEKKRAGSERISGKGYPAQKELATPTDLTPQEVQRIVEAVNPLIADAFALYTKTKNFHWHLAGSHFRDYHLLLDEQAGGIFESIDPLAERVRRIGGTTIRSISHIGQLQTIKDDNNDFLPADKMIQELITDNQQIAARQRAAIEVCDQNRDTPTSNLLQDFLDQTERRIWSHSASLEMVFYSGHQFPAEYLNNAFAVQHGSWNRARRTGYKVIRVPVRNGVATGEYEDFHDGVCHATRRRVGSPSRSGCGKRWIAVRDRRWLEYDLEDFLSEKSVRSSSGVLTGKDTGTNTGRNRACAATMYNIYSFSSAG